MASTTRPVIMSLGVLLAALQGTARAADCAALARGDDWVEKGQAPTRLITTGPALPGRSRPLCAFPAVAHYNGTGSQDDAASFTCGTEP